MLSGSGAVRPGFGPPFFSGRPLRVCFSGLLLGGGFGGAGLVVGGVVGGLVVNCIVDASIKKVFCCCFGSPPPVGPLPPLTLFGSGWGVWGAGVASARGAPVIRWAVSAPVSVIVVCCVLFVDI